VTQSKTTSKFSWGVLLFLFAVILWGSFVRASGSGNGCGNHWPLCGGQVIPESPTWKTVVEFVHRVTSGLSLLLCFAICFLSFKNFPKKSLVRKAGVATLVLILSEALVGAGLVLFQLVEKDQSQLRAVSLAIHLINTFFLLGAVTLTARWSELPSPRLLRFGDKTRSIAFASVAAVVLVLILGASGAVTALGDTLFPAASLQAGFAQDLSPTKHFLIQLRIFHPLIAVAVSLYLIMFARAFRDPSQPRRMMHIFFVLGLQLFQLCLGVANLVFLAPTAIQMLHLLTADFIWVNLILLLSEIWITKGEVNSTANSTI
jgi:cytochrome c oxidase assembly protein subunit 15